MIDFGAATVVDETDEAGNFLVPSNFNAATRGEPQPMRPSFESDFYFFATWNLQKTLKRSVKCLASPEEREEVQKLLTLLKSPSTFHEHFA